MAAADFERAIASLLAVLVLERKRYSACRLCPKEGGIGTDESSITPAVVRHACADSIRQPRILRNVTFAAVALQKVASSCMDACR